MAEQEEISISTKDSLVDTTAEKIAEAEDSSKVLDSKIESETRELPEVIATHERELLKPFFHDKKPLHKHFGGGKAGDLFLWKNKKQSAAVLGGATVIWVLFELLGFHLTSVVCHVLIFSIGLLFLWSNATVFINKSPPHIPDVHISEELVHEVASFLRDEINHGLAEFRGVASGRDLKKFLSVVAVLWIVSIIGGLVNFLTLAYILLVSLFSVPIIYQKHKKEVDAFADKAISEIKKQYKVLDVNVLSKIPKLPLKRD